MTIQNSTMRACVLHKKEDLRVEARETPHPEAGQVMVRFAYGGICGSDLHYYFNGANGSFVVQHPFVLGHEVSGVVAAVGPGVAAVKPGDHVAINPGWQCARCDYCRSGRGNLCPNTRFFGSASTMPHTDGAFQELITVAERQCVPVPADFDLSVAAVAEPLAVCMHAVNRAGSLMGKSVLITGAGPIGSLILLVVRTMGAKEITITDVLDGRLERAKLCGADSIINVTTDTPESRALNSGELPFDVIFEASGNRNALNSAIASVVKGGAIVQVGFLPAGELGITANNIMAKELNFIGVFRFGLEFNWAVEYLVHGNIDVSPLITHKFSTDQVDEAFTMAIDGAQSTKVQIYFPD